MATPRFGTGVGFTVARITLYGSLAGNPIGWEWVEGSGDFVDITNATTDGPIFASVATLFSPVPIPLADLNFSLSGFGVESAILELAPNPLTAVPEPSTMALLTIGLCGLLGIAWRRTNVVRTSGSSL